MDLRACSYGYRFGDQDFPKLPEKVSERVKISLKPNVDEVSPRRPMKISLGCHVEGVTLPKPDIFDAKSAIAGSLKRTAYVNPKPDRKRLLRLRDFVRRWLDSNMKPLTSTDVMESEDWINSRPYAEARKEQLRQTNRSRRGLPKTVVKSFIKDESYTDFKFPRPINSRDDEFKCEFGPYVSAIEERMYQHPSFIKHIPVKDRPRYISEYLFPSLMASVTDYSSFEAAFQKEIMEVLDQEMFKFFLKDLWNPRIQYMLDALKNENVCHFKWYKVLVQATRMSGEMNTSLSNGFANLMVGLFLCEELGLGDCRMVVEGDDGLMTTTSGKYPSQDEYASLGFTIKLAVQDKNEASFCGIIFDPKELINVTDPREVLAEFGWSTQRYAKYSSKKLMALLRAKSMSYLYQYPGCPIIQELALYGLRMTRSYDVSHFVRNDINLDNYKREIYLKALQADNRPTTVGDSTRMLVDRLYGISLRQQLDIEEYLRSLDTLQPLQIILDWPETWTRYYATYVHMTRREPLVFNESMEPAINLVRN